MHIDIQARGDSSLYAMIANALTDNKPNLDWITSNPEAVSINC
jgi:hypothetical protein